VVEEDLPAQIVDLMESSKNEFENERKLELLSEQAGRMLALRTGEKFGLDRKILSAVLMPGTHLQELRQRIIVQAGEEGVEQALSAELLPRDISLDDLVSEVAERLLSEVLLIKKLRQSGKTHISSEPDLMPENFIRFVASEMITVCMLHQLQGPMLALGTLLKELLGIRHYGISEYKEPHRWKVAVLLKAKYPNSSANEIAKKLGVDRSTVSRWFQSEEFLLATEKLRQDSDEMYGWEHAWQQGLYLPDP